MNTGEKLKFARESKELTQQEVMRLTGINNKTLSSYERGVTQPDLETFAALLKLYGQSADSFLGLGKSEPQPLSSSEMKLLRFFRSLSRSRQRDVLIQTEALARSEE
ncbi:MAG: helix-turn-helix domain-containing protein [Clostridia bacterium]